MPSCVVKGSSLVGYYLQAIMSFNSCGKEGLTLVERSAAIGTCNEAYEYLIRVPFLNNSNQIFSTID